MTDRQEATSAAETLHRHGDLDPSKWEEAAVVTDRPNDLEKDSFAPHSTFAERAAARKRTSRKAVSDESAENKAVDSSESKRPAKKAAAKKAAKK